MHIVPSDANCITTTNNVFTDSIYKKINFFEFLERRKIFTQNNYVSYHNIKTLLNDR